MKGTVNNGNPEPEQIFMPSLCQDLSKNARSWPDSIAVSDGQLSWTWSQFEDVVGNIGQQLRRLGAGSGSAVSVYMPNNATYIAAVYAIWSIGAAFCPINYRLSVVEAGHMMIDAKVSIAIVDDEGTNLPSEEISTIERSDAIRPLSEIALDYQAIGADEPAWLFFTSGTSGRPKPAVITHRQLDAVVSNGVIDLMRGLTRSDAALAVAPLSHGALTHVLRQVRIGGHTVVYDRRRFEEQNVLDLIAQQSIRSTFLVPTMVRRLCDAAKGNNYHGTLTHLLSGGEPITRGLVESVENIFGRVLTNYYGLAEVTGAIAQALPEAVHTATSGPVPVGQPRIGTAIELRRDDGMLAEGGEHGEIWVSGSNMFAGYLIDGSIDRSELVDGWFRTKDIGYFRNGTLYVDGRSSDMYISGGSNVYPAEVERALNSHPNVKHAAVVGVEDTEWGEVGIAFIIPASGGVNEDDLMQLVKTQLGSYKTPKYFERVGSFPYTPMDKIDKKALKHSYLRRSRPEGAIDGNS